MNFSISLVEALWPSQPPRTIRGEGDLTTLSLRGKHVRCSRAGNSLLGPPWPPASLPCSPWELLRAGASEGGHARMVTPEDAPFDTVVVLMMENRSFDHLLGWLPSA